MRILNGKSNMLYSPELCFFTEHRNLPTLFRWESENLVSYNFPKLKEIKIFISLYIWLIGGGINHRRKK